MPLILPPPRKTSSSGSTANPARVVEPRVSPPQSTTARASQNNNKTKPKPRIPTYEERCRLAAQAASLPPAARKTLKPFIPRRLEDFADGGAYPEVPVAQYPRHMGNPHLGKPAPSTAIVKSTSNVVSAPSSSAVGSVRGGAGSSKALVNVQVDGQTGEVSYDAIVTGGTNRDKLVYTKLDDMREKQAKPEDIALPTREEEAAEAERTQAALDALLGQKTALDKPKGSALEHAKTSQNIEAKTQFIQYTPREDAPGYNPAASQRIIQMVPAQVDPMMPPKHRHIKAPRGPAEDFVPVLHAPPTKLSKEEREAWNIPACISNWKNTRGYTIPLDKRLAADGRGLREHSINPNFATLSESLYEAERQARKEVRMRAQIQKRLALQEKEQREEELRELANRARMERGGAVVDGAAVETGRSVGEDKIDEAGGSTRDENSVSDGSDTEDRVAAQQRERLRIERKREREREMRFENSMEAKKKRLEEDRDVSEKIALGMHTGTGGGGDVDSRLYNQSGGMDSGFGRDDEYNTYSQPLFNRQGATSSSIYRPTRGEAGMGADEQYDKLVKGTSKFVPDKGFAGAEGGMEMQAGPRTAPVQFEREGK